MIKHEGGKWILYSHDGSQKLGEFESEQAAMEQEREIMAAVHAQTAMDPNSLSGKLDIVRRAFRQQGDMGGFPAISNAGGCPDAIDVYEAEIVCRNSQGFWRVPWQTSDGSDRSDASDLGVRFGAPIRVAVQYVPVSEAEVEIRQPTGEITGSSWDVRLMKAGRSRHERPFPGSHGQSGPWYYTEEAIQSMPAVFEGAPLYAFEFDGRVFSHLWGLTTAEKVKRGFVRNLIGYVQSVRETGTEAVATASLLADRATEAIKEKLLDLFRRGRQDLVGLSIDAQVMGVPVQTREGLAFAVLQFAKPATVDVATSPAMGGAFLRALEGLPEKEVAMVEELLKKLRARRPDLAAKLGDTPTEAQVKEALLLALDGSGSDGSDRSDVSDTQSREAIRQDLEESRKLRCSLVLDKRLADAKLPAPVEKKIRARYDGRIFEAPALEADITGEKEMLDALAQEGTIQGLGTTRAEIVLESGEKLQIAMNKMYGVPSKEGEARNDLPRFKSLQHAFQVITGRNILDMMSHRITTVQEAIVAATWPNILGASMHRRLMAAFAEPAWGDDRIVRRRPGGISNFKTQEAVRLKYLADLSDVDPEAADYPMMAEPGDEKVSYEVIQKGNTMGISRRTLINDDLGAALQIPDLFGRAARRTRAKYVWNFWITNATYDVDSKAWFHADHGNLGSVALTANITGANAVLAAIIRLAQMTEPGSGEPLGLPELRRLMLWLVVPTGLLGVAHTLNISPLIDNGAGVLVTNPVYHFFGADDDRIIVNALLSDATDWGLFRDPAEMPSVEIGYLNDQDTPEFWVASVPTIGQMFVADTQEFKIRYEFGADVMDFRAADKSVVAG